VDPDCILAACPNCGKEVMGDFTYCPFCEAPLKPTCPSCKREIQSDFLMCPYCGFGLRSETQPTPSRLLYRERARSTFLNLVVVLSFAGGVIAILQGASESTYDFALYSYLPPPPMLASALMLVQVALGVLLVILGIVMLVVAYGLASRKSFSRRYLLRLMSLTFLISLLELSCDTVISGMFSLARSAFAFDIFFVLWSFLQLIVIWRYVVQQDERDILSLTATNPLPPPTSIEPSGRYFRLGCGH